MAATNVELATLASALGVVLPVGVSEADTLIPILEQIKVLLDDLEDRVDALENP